MKYLAEGFQYKVYTIDDQKVFKEELGYLNRLFKIFKITRSRNFSFLNSIKKAIISDRKNKESLRIMKDKLKNIPTEIFADPEFVGNTSNFTQNKVLIINQFLKKSEDIEVKRIIDEYVELQKRFWSYGMHDAVHKFQSNYGVDSQRKLVCIDFGEFVFNKEDVKNNIEKKGWLKRSSYQKWEDSEIKRYYTEKMNECMTLGNLDEYWV